MTTNLKLLCVFAHPDDESLGNGGILARYAAEGIETYLVVATRGERGWWGNEVEYPGLEVYQSVFGELVMHIDGMERRGVGWPEWAITTRIDTRTYRQTVWEAILCHESQLSVYHQLEHVSQEDEEELWDSQTYYRALSLVNGGRGVEEDLFEGLR